MNPLLPKDEKKQTGAKKKAKSAKYKGIERISRSVFYCIVALIFALFIFVLTLSVILGERELIEESAITVLTI